MAYPPTTAPAPLGYVWLTGLCLVNLTTFRITCSNSIVIACVKMFGLHGPALCLRVGWSMHIQRLALLSHSSKVWRSRFIQLFLHVNNSCEMVLDKLSERDISYWVSETVCMTVRRCWTSCLNEMSVAEWVRLCVWQWDGVGQAVWTRCQLLSEWDCVYNSETVLDKLSQQDIGSFVVRDSTTHAGCYALSIRVDRHDSSLDHGISHYLITRTSRGTVKLKVEW